jgi:hypothetical protein
MNLFLKHVKEVAAKNGVYVSLINAPTVMSGAVSCSGYFTDYPNPELVVATQKKESEWLEILVHEFNHMNQFLEHHSSWTDLNIEGSSSKQTSLLDLWLSRNVELNDIQLSQCIDIIIRLELDCEKRSVQTIKDYSLPINTQDYIKRANSYVLFYHLVKRYRTWSRPGKAPYMIKEVVDKMPDEFNLDYSNPPKELLDIIEKHCISLY